MENIALIAFDFDGVLTDNRVLVLDNGQEAVFCSRSDGLAFDMFRKKEVPILVISNEINPVVAARVRKLRVPFLQAVSDKAKALSDYCAKAGFPLAKTCFVGNDLNDLAVMRIVKTSFCPADAHPLVKRAATVVLKTRGGEGVVRELAERIIDDEEKLSMFAPKP